MPASKNKQSSSNTNSSEQKQKKSKKKKRGLLLIIFIVIAFALLSRHEPVKTIDCTPEIIATEPDVIMLGAWWCTYCYQAKKYFQRYDIHYCEYDMEHTSIGKQRYKDNGGGAVPIILIGEHRLRGFNPQQVEAALLSLNKKPNSSE